MRRKCVFPLTLFVALGCIGSAFLVWTSIESRQAFAEKLALEELCVVPITKTPDAEVLSAMKIVFGKRLTLSREYAKLGVFVLRGKRASVDQAVWALGGVVDRKRARRSTNYAGKNASQAIALVILRRTRCETIAKAMREILPDKLEITARSASRGLIIEGNKNLVDQAVSLARQLDRQEVHRSVQGLIGGRELTWEDD